MTREYKAKIIRGIINEPEEEEEIDGVNIYEGVTINDIYYEFKETAFFEGRVTMFIPAGFADMPLEWARLKYPSCDRPQIIKTNGTGSINLTLNLISNNICDEHIPEIKEGMQNILKRLNPAYLFIEEGIERIGEKSVGFFAFKSPAIDMALFNFMFFAEVAHDVMMGCFNCAYDEHRPWRPVARQMLKSIRVDSEQAEEAIILH